MSDVDVWLRRIADVTSSVIVWVGARPWWARLLLWFVFWWVLLPMRWVTRQPTSRLAHGALALSLVVGITAIATDDEPATDTIAIDDTRQDVGASTAAAPDDATDGTREGDGTGDTPGGDGIGAGLGTDGDQRAGLEDDAPRRDDANGAAGAGSRQTPGSDSSPAVEVRGDDAPVVLEGIVTHIVDGDTIDLADGTRIRLAIVDTPEVNGASEACGPEARDFTATFVADTAVLIVRPTTGPATDPFGRTLGEVVRRDDGASLNVALVAAGLGVIDVRFVEEDPDLARRARSTAATAETPVCSTAGPAGPAIADTLPRSRDRALAVRPAPTTTVMATMATARVRAVASRARTRPTPRAIRRP